MCALLSLFFFGGWFAPFVAAQAPFWLGLKIAMFAFCFVWMRATYPRLRYDQLMQLGWKSFLPVSVGLIVVVSGFLLAADGLPTEISSL